VPNPAFWGSVTVLAALIPTLGTTLVILPAAAYLYFASGLAPAAGLLIWGALAVGLIDNFLSPQLIRRGTRIHPFLVLLSVLGGISLAGPIGFLAGPLVLSILFALLDIYSVLVLKREIAR
jgi:predicted PurR-regulated permease PerM